ncbi:MAG TPA: hypothetical protein VD994_21810 [Prosthecobacter sp.]|nr:hypothetical protein [Prosthecobacter sp.]
MTERSPPPPADYFFERLPWNNRWILFAIALLVSCFDYLASPIIFFPILFVIPVALMAWNCGLRTALILGTALCLIRFAIQFAWGIPYALPVALINGGLRLGVLLFITFLVGKLSEQTRTLRARVRTLEGILPTCSFCKDIRDEAGNWHQIEAYVTSRTEARFSHGVCPDCAAKHYGLHINTLTKSS